MVELLPLELPEDLQFVEDLLHQFNKRTGSLVAADLLKDWPAQASKFVKVSVPCIKMYLIILLASCLLKSIVHGTLSTVHQSPLH